MDCCRLVYMGARVDICEDMTSKGTSSPASRD